MMMSPGPQQDGSWFVPMHLIRKDQAIVNTRDGGGKRFRNWEYRRRQNELLKYLAGHKIPFIDRIYSRPGTKARPEQKPRKNVKMMLTIYHAGCPKGDGVTQMDSLQDTLEGVFYKNDWQVGEGTFQEISYAGFDGLQWTIQEVLE